MAGFLSGITLMCFTASYLVSFALELTRPWFRSGVRGAIMIGFAVAGVLAHTLYLVAQAVRTDGLPLSSPYEWYLVGAWALAVIYLCLALVQRKAAIGLFILPLVLGLIAVAATASHETFAREPAQRVWGMLHGGFVLSGIVCAGMATATGIMYLVHASRLKRKVMPNKGLRLPSLEWLDLANGRFLAASLTLLGIGFGCGAILNLIKAREAEDPVRWTDPLILSSGGLFAFMLIVTLTSWGSRHLESGRRILYLTVLTGLFLLVAIGLNLWMPHAKT